MVDKVSVNPLSVRGAGDIVSPKSLTDFGAYNSKLISSSESVDGELMTVYTESYLTGSYFTITAQRFVPIGSGSVTVDVVLRSISDDSVIANALVSCFVNDELFTTGTTGSNGSVSFSVVLNDYTSFYRIRLKFDGSELVAGCFGGVGVVQGDVSSISLLGLSDVVVSGEDVGLLASVRAVDVDGESIGVPFQPVEFLQFNPLLFYFEGRGGFEVDSWIVQPNATLTSDDTGSTISASGGTAFVWANLYGTATHSQYGDYYGDVVVDLDIISAHSSSRLDFYEDTTLTTPIAQQPFYLQTGHNRVVKTGDTYEHFVDGVSQGTVTKTIRNPYRIGILTNNESSVKFKNFIIGGY